MKCTCRWALYWALDTPATYQSVSSGSALTGWALAGSGLTGAAELAEAELPPEAGGTLEEEADDELLLEESEFDWPGEDSQDTSCDGVAMVPGSVLAGRHGFTGDEGARETGSSRLSIGAMASLGNNGADGANFARHSGYMPMERGASLHVLHWRCWARGSSAAP